MMILLQLSLILRDIGKGSLLILPFVFCFGPQMFVDAICALLNCESFRSAAFLDFRDILMDRNIQRRQGDKGNNSPTTVGGYMKGAIWDSFGCIWRPGLLDTLTLCASLSEREKARVLANIFVVSPYWGGGGIP